MTYLAAEDAVRRYRRVRARTEALVEGLSPEDRCAQAFCEASPAKWHMAHTTWFFETFLLGELAGGHRPFDPAFRTLFNSYYDAVGERPPQARRGLLTRPSMATVSAYRQAVDRAMTQLLAEAEGERAARIAPLLDLGLAHEEQHQELILTDGLALFAANPLEPAWRKAAKAPPGLGADDAPDWVAHGGGLVEIGHAGPGFAYDNEGPRHPVWLAPFRLAVRPVTNGQWLAFMEDGGYRRPTLWQSDGWDAARAQGWAAPEYWRRQDGAWTVMTLFGREPVDMAAPVCHVSWFEADAFAAWAGARLPDETEWEAVAATMPRAGNFLDAGFFRPLPAMGGGAAPARMFGDVWEWTASPHRPYPGWRAAPGALGEYNGKFMMGRMVCRGGSFATPVAHMRATYRNFWWPSARWQFTGLRLAEDA